MLLVLTDNYVQRLEKTLLLSYRFYDFKLAVHAFNNRAIASERRDKNERSPVWCEVAADARNEL